MEGYVSLKTLIFNLEKRLQNAEEQQQSFSSTRRQIEEHFERCIHALEVRQQDLVQQLDLLHQGGADVTNEYTTHLQDTIYSCSEILKTGALVFKRNKASAEQIWLEGHNLKLPSYPPDLWLNIEIALPHDILDAINTHGKVTILAGNPAASVNTAPVEVKAEEQLSEEEGEILVRKLVDFLDQKEQHLNEQLHLLEVRQLELQEREAQAERHKKLLRDHTRQLEEVLAELLTTTDVVQQQTGDCDLDAAHLQLARLYQFIAAQQKLQVEERRQRERVEWLQKQIEFYQLKGMSPAQRSFRNYLKDVKRICRLRNLVEHSVYPLRCFISYAWEMDPTANKKLQERLQRLKGELEVAGMEVTLDIHNMKDEFMLQGIERAHKVLLICTPCLKERAVEGNDNNLKLELRMAVEKAESTDEFIVPLIFSGSFSTAMPPEVGSLLAIDFMPEADYYASMASLAPQGLIPTLLGLERNKDYKRMHDRLFGELDDYAQQLGSM